MARKFKLLKDISTFDVEAKAGTIGIEKIEPTGSTDSKVWFDNGRFFYRLSTVNTWKDWFEEIKEEPVQPLTEKTVMEFMSEIEERFNGTGITLFREWREFRRRKQSEQPPSLKDNVLSSGEAIDITLKPSTNEGRDWEITSFRDNGGATYVKTKMDWYESVNLGGGTTKHMIDCGYKIMGVKRLSDGEVFTVGDEIKYWVKDNSFEGKIERLEKTEFGLWAFGNPLSFQIDLAYSKIEKLSPSSTNDKEPLFTTEDGIGIKQGYKGDLWRVFIVPHSYESWKPYNLGMPQYINSDEEKYFSTEESAKEYCLLNKPCLSVEDCRQIYNNFMNDHNDSFTNHCKKVAKSKSSQ